MKLRGASTIKKDEKINNVNLAFEKQIENMRKKYELHIIEIEDKLVKKEHEHTIEKTKL